MRVDVSQSIHEEADSIREEFDPAEIKKLRVLLRRLRFLEQQVRKSGGIANGGNGGAVFAELEAEALEFVLTELGYLAEK